MEQTSITTHSPEETEQIAEDLAKKILPKSIVCLYGDLGAGKTTFARGFARGLGVEGNVNSPTFTLIRQYGIENGEIQTLYHIDLYRLENNRSIKEIGIDDVFSDPNVIVLIEWAERLGDLLPTKRIDITLTYLTDESREITIIDHAN